jgi:fibronectin type 3 domain-containing protein
LVAVARGWTLSIALLCLLPLASFAPAASASSVSTVGTLSLPACTQQCSGQGLVGASAVYYNGASYVLGGRMADGTYSDAIYRFDPSTGVGTVVARMPTEPGATSNGRQSGAAVVLGDTIYYFGGAVIVCVVLSPGNPCSDVPKSTTSIVAYKPGQSLSATNPSVVANLPGGHGLWGEQAVAYSGKAYLFGGFEFDVSQPTNIARHDWIEVFDPNGGALGPTVSKLDPTLPYPEQDAAIGLIGNSAYIFGGLSNNNTENPCPKNHVYNQSTGQYDDNYAPVCNTDGIIGVSFSTTGVDPRGIVAHLPYRAQFVSGAVVNDKVYIPGARLQSGDASDKIVEFDPAAVNPIRILTPTLPLYFSQPGFFAAPVTTDGTSIWMFGGRAQDLTSMTENVTLINPGPTPPWAPRSAVAHAQPGGVVLSWQPPAYDGDSPVTDYKIYRTPDGGAEVYLTDVPTLSYTDSTAKAGQQYDYRITAVNDKGESATSAIASTAASVVPPAAVPSFSADAGDGKALLTWTTPQDDGGSNITGYRVYVNESDVPAADVSAATHEYTVSGLANGVTYEFGVAAVNSKGQGTMSAIVRATPKAVPPPPDPVTASVASTNTVTVSWTAPDVTVKGFVVLRGTDPTRLTAIASAPATASTYTDTNADQGRTYYYAVASQNDVGVGQRSEISRVSLVTKPSPPQNVFVAPLQGALRVTWQAPADLGTLDPSIVTYTVVRDGTRIANDLPSTSFLDKPLIPGQAHAYTVIASNGIESDPSAPATGTALAIQNKAPSAVLAIPTSVVKANDTVNIDGTGSSDPDGVVARYVYDFGDGTPPLNTTDSTATHAYTTNGTYTVTLKVLDDKGALSNTATASVIVGSPEAKSNTNQNPDATLTPPTGKGSTMPGSKSGKLVPGFEAAPLALALAVALAMRRRR